MYHQFNIQQLYLLPTQCIYVFLCISEQTTIISLYSINCSFSGVARWPWCHASKTAPLRHTQNQPKCPPLPPAAHPNTPLPSTVPSALANALPCYQPIFTRRTSGHCLWTFSATNPSDSLFPPPLRHKNKCNASHCTLCAFSCLSILVLKCSVTQPPGRSPVPGRERFSWNW